MDPMLQCQGGQQRLLCARQLIRPEIGMLRSSHCKPVVLLLSAAGEARERTTALESECPTPNAFACYRKMITKKMVLTSQRTSHCHALCVILTMVYNAWHLPATWGQLGFLPLREPHRPKQIDDRTTHVGKWLPVGVWWGMSCSGLEAKLNLIPSKEQSFFCCRQLTCAGGRGRHICRSCANIFRTRFTTTSHPLWPKWEHI